MKPIKIIWISLVMVLLTGCTNEANKENIKTESLGSNSSSSQNTDSEKDEDSSIENNGEHTQEVSGNTAGNAEKQIELVVATDIHYFTKDLVDDGPLFQKMLVSSDGKQINYITEITDAFLEEVIKIHPNGLILSGDLTFNGEFKSHEELGEKLKLVSDEGIPVYVIPGNHDINNYYAGHYTANKIVAVDRTSPEQFEKIYGSFGLNGAIYKDEKTLSYVSEVSKEVWLFMIDTNRYEFNSQSYPSEPSGVIGRDTFRWLETCLKEAVARGVTPIVVMHHNLLKHNEKLFYGFTLDGYQEVVDLFHKYKVKVTLSGHIHMQNIASDQTKSNTIYDIVTSALSVFTNQYGIIRVTPGVQISYHTNPVDIESYAKNRGLTDENLLDFENYSYHFFTTSSHNRVLEKLKEKNIPEKEKEIMADFSDRVNASYFSGIINEIQAELLESEGYKLWMKYGDDTFNGYITRVVNETAKDENQIVINLK